VSACWFSAETSAIRFCRVEPLRTGVPISNQFFSKDPLGIAMKNIG